MPKETVPGKTLAYQEEAQMRQRVAELKDIRDSVEVTQGVAFETKDRSGVEKEIKKMEDTLRSHGVTEIDLNPEEKARLREEEAKLRAALQVGMPTWKKYVSLKPIDGSQYTELVNLISSWDRDKTRVQMIQRWKKLRRLLDPHNPKADSTVHLFPQ